MFEVELFVDKINKNVIATNKLHPKIPKNN